MHDHAVAGEPELLLGSESISVRSLGLDIGSATTHLAVVDLCMERVRGHFEVTSREVVFRSPVSMTPYRGDSLIDFDELGPFVRSQCAAATEQVGAIDVSVALMTGAAALPENAARIEDLTGEGVVRFLSVCAGDRLEAELAAHGSGAIAASIGGRSVLNIDVGGATTKFSWCRAGRVTKTATYDFGARVITLDDNGVITRVNPSGVQLGLSCGLQVAPGRLITRDERCALAERLAEGIVAVAASDTGWEASFLREASTGTYVEFDAVVVSGGVASLLDGANTATFGDLGDALGSALAKWLSETGYEVRIADEAIRSTALGVSRFAVQVSGVTVAREELELPLYDVPVVRVDPELMAGDLSSVGSYIADRLAVLGSTAESGPVALMLPWRGAVTYERLDALAAAVLDGLSVHVAQGRPTVVVVDEDIGQIFGRHLVEERGLTGALLSLDGVELRDFDFVDIDESGSDRPQIMITVKSLEFHADAARWVRGPECERRPG